MSRKLGEIYVSLILKDDQFIDGIKRVKAAAEGAARDIEKTSGDSNQRRARTHVNADAQILKSVDQTYAQLTRGIEAAKHAYNQSLGPQKTYMQNMIETSKHVIQAAPGYAIATAAIASVYVALRAVTGEFVSGLSAVEDYSLKVASMGAFLTTFSTALTKTNASEIYRASTAEAQVLVQTMEKLDARTIATGKDLTTMAEQFIKGGVRIDTTNKGTLDGFVNIANALKLMTQGQNQEIQMRQEIRALVQGQMKDTNILAKTLQSIDPNIKEHIKLWRQQGTLIENVGGLLAGFGPAAKDLEKTWAVVGSTMETIHTRILRDGFKKTYDELIQLAKSWNSALMDSNGNLTPLADSLSSLVSTTLAFSKNMLDVAGYFATSGIIYIGILAITKLIEIKLVGAVYALTAAMAKNPLFMIALAAVSIAGVKTWAEGVITEMDKIEKANEKTATSWEKMKLRFAESTASMFSLDPIIKPFVEFGKFVWNLDVKLKDLLITLGLFKGTKSDMLPSGPDLGRTRAGGSMTPDLTPLKSHIEPLSAADAGAMVGEVKEYTDTLKRQADVYGMNAAQLARYEIEQGKYAETIRSLQMAGKFQLAEDLKATAIREASRIVSSENNKKSLEGQQQSRDSLNNTIKSLESMNLTQEKSQKAIWESNFANSEYVKSLKLTGRELEDFKSKIFSAAEGADQRKATIEIEKYIEKLKEKIVVLNTSKAGLTEYQVEEGEVAKLFEKAGLQADKFKDIIKELTKEFVQLSKESQLEKLEDRILTLNEKYSTGLEKIEAQNKKALDQIKDLKTEYEKKGLSAVDIDGKKLAAIEELSRREERYQRESIADWEIANTAKGRSYKELSEGIYKSLTDSFEKIFDKGENVFKSLTDSIISLFKRMLAQMVALAIARPIIVPVISAIGGTMGMSTDAQASVLKGMGITGSGTGSLAGLAGAAQIGSMGAGYTSPGTSAVTAGVGLAGVGFEIYKGTVGATMAALQQGVAVAAAKIGLGATGMSMAATDLPSGLAGQISGMATEAFAGWTAGVSTFVIALLRGQSFKDAALQGIGAGLGAWGGYTVGFFFGGPIGGSIGAVIGSTIGSWIGSLFGSKENKFTLTELVKPFIVDTIFEKTKGLEAMAWKSGPGGNEWYTPVANAYAQMVDVINTSFTENVFAFAEAMPDMLESLFLDKIAATDYAALLSEASSGRWGISEAGGALEGVATAYAAALAKVAERSFTAAIADFFATAAPAEMLGPELAGTWDILTDQAQSYVKSLFVKAGEAVTSGGLEAGLTEAGKIAESMQSLQDALAPIKEIIDTNGLTEYELSIRDINKQFDDYAAKLKAAGVDLVKYTQLEEARAISISKVVRELREARLVDAATNLTASFDAEQASITTQHENALIELNDQLKIVQDSSSKLTSIVDKMRSALDRMNLTGAITLDQRDTAFSILQTALSSARGGDFSGLENIDNQLNVLTTSSEGLFASFEDYQRDYWKTYNAITDGESIAKDQLSLEERTIQLIEQQISDENSRFQVQTALLTSQLNALLGINNSVLSLGVATQQYKSAQSLVDLSTNTASSNPASLPGTVADMYEAALGREADPSGLIYWATQLALAGGNVDAIKEAFFTSAEGYGETVQRFATGGSFKVAGDSGVDNLSMSRLRVTAGEMVNISKKDSIAEMADEIKYLREELGIANFEIAKSNKKIAGFLERWDGDGVPEVRVLV